MRPRDYGAPHCPPLNAINCFVAGLSHDDSHLAQIDNVVAQAKAAGR